MQPAWEVVSGDVLDLSFPTQGSPIPHFQGRSLVMNLRSFA